MTKENLTLLKGQKWNFGGFSFTSWFVGHERYSKICAKIVQINFRLQALRGLYNFIRGFRRAYKQGAHYLLTILISIACGDQSSLWGKIAKIGVKIGEHFHFRLILNIYFGQMLSPHPLVWGIVWRVPSPRTAFPRPSRSMLFGDVFEANTRARITWPETHWPRGIMRPRD